MHEKTQQAIEFLEKIRIYLENLGLLTLLSEISENAKKEGNDPDPFRVLISTVLSVRNRDESTAIATKELFDIAKLNTPEKIMKADIENIEQRIRRSGMYKTKAQRVKKISEILVEKYDSQVPKDLNELLELPGVGRKVANCVLVYAYNQPAIPVDVHVHRISNRMGLIKTAKPEETEIQLMEIYPKKYWTLVNDAFVIFGKTVCKPISPKCNECPITDDCPKLIIIQKKTKRNKRSKVTRKK